jgi:T5SS/PEP-CTERM-associated repeat protein
MATTYNWIWNISEWGWQTGSTGGIGGAPGPSDIAYVDFAPGYLTFSQNLDVDWLDVTGNITASAIGTLTGDITANTIVASDVVFTGSVTTGWFTDAPSGGATTVTFAGGDLTASGPVLIGGATLAPVLFDVSGGAVIQANESGAYASVEVGAYGDMEVNQGTVFGTLISVTAGLIDVNSSGTLAAHQLAVDGTSLNGPGTIFVNSGGVMNTDTAVIGVSGFDSDSGTVDVNGGTWTNTASLAVALGLTGAATGVLAISNAGTVSAGGAADALVVGVRAGSTGSVTVSGSGSALLVTGSGTATVGNAGTGDLVINGGGAATIAGDLIVGGTTGSSGAILVTDGGSTLSVAGNILLGDAATGTGTIAAGGAIDVAGTLEVGVSAGAGGTLALSGTGTVLKAADAEIGVAGQGTLTEDTGGTIDVTSGTLDIGVSQGGTGIATLAGTADVMALAVGDAGSGSLTLAAGGALSTLDDVVIGAAGSGSGAVTIVSGGDLADGGTLIVGDSGSGVLAVTGGSLEVFSGQAVLGRAASGNGELDISGGAGIALTGELIIGVAGNGTVLDTSGSLSVAGELLIGASLNSGGVLLMMGSGSQVQSGDLLSGTGGGGDIEVSNKAVLTTNGDALMAGSDDPNSSQSEEISSKGQWQVSGLLDVGQIGQAAGTVDTGAQIIAGRVVIGDQGYAQGQLQVSNTVAVGAALEYGASMIVGQLGAGDLEITQAGTAAASGAGLGTVEVGASLGSSGIINLTDANSELTATGLYVGGDTTGAGGTGAVSIGAGATVLSTATTVWTSGTMSLAGGVLTGGPLTLEGTLSGFGTVGGALVNTGTVLAIGGDLTVSGVASGSGTLLLENGTLDLKGAVIGQAITFEDGSSRLIVDQPGSFAPSAILLQDGDQIELANFSTITGASLTSAGTVTVSGIIGGNAGTYQLTNVGFVPGSSTQFVTGADSITNTPYVQLACFAAGTRLATARGVVPVEWLHVGDRVRTANGALRPVRWIGWRRIDLTRHPDPRRAQPIRILADAFADGVPSRDLVLSPDHAVFDRGRLVPIRLLVNDATIRRESRRRDVTYFHVELDSHDLVLAEGLACESYLDTGNRGIFENADHPLILHPDFRDPVEQNRRRLAGSCAPLTDAPGEVEPLWFRLADRAQALGAVLAEPELTGEPALGVRAGARRLRPVVREGARYLFALPAGSAWLVSRAAYPSDARPWIEDQRRLGVMVRRLTLLGDRGGAIPLDDPALVRGWWAPETDGVSYWRWTDGAAALPVLDAPAVLEVELAGTLSYPLAPAPAARAAKQLKVL